MAQDDDISNAINIARRDATADAIQSKINGLNQNLAGLDLEANVPQFNTGLTQPQIGGAGMPQSIGWSPKRTDFEISSSHYDDGRSKAYVATVNPMDFLHATTRDDEHFNKIWDEAGNLNLKKLTKETQTPFLEFEDGKIGGHEGRHRMAALAKQGYTEVPIVVKPYWSSGRNFSPVDQMTFAPQFEGRNPITINNAIPLNKNYADQIGNLMSSYDEHFKSGGFARNNYATDGSVLDNNTIEMPHSLEELQDWHKTHPAPKPMVRASDDPTSILYNERKLDMPNSLEELQNWARMHHASGGSIDHIAKAMHLARKHFDDGGDSGGNDQGGGDNPRADSLAQSQQASADAQAAADNRANNQDVGRFSFGQNVDTSGANLTGHEAPTGLVSYTTQRETTPYEGTPMTAAQDPSTAFGMAYPSLVGVQNTPAGAAALLANLGYESTQGGKAFQPNAISGSGYGLAQWTDPSRQASFFNAMQPGTTANNPIAKMAILGSTTPGQQLGYAMNEIQQNYPQVAREMATAQNIPTATENIMNRYESPATNESLDARIALANQIAKGTGLGSFAQETLNQAPSGNSFAAISPSVSSAVRSALGAGRGDVGTLDSSLAKAMASNDTINSGANAVVGTVDGGNANAPAANVPAANAPTPQPNILDKIFGSTQDQIDKLAAAGQYAGMDKQQYADQFAGGDINAVKERIVYDNGQPKVDYYTKDLSQALFGDPLKALSSGLGNLFSQKQNYDPLTGQYRPDISASVGQEPSPFGGHGGGQQPIPYIPPVETASTAAPVAPVAPYVPQKPYIPPANTPYASLGANFVDPRMYQNPLFSQVLATGGKVHGNNAMGNALRMAMANKP